MNSDVYFPKYIFLILIVLSILFGIDIVKRIRNFRQRFNPNIELFFYPKYASGIFVKNAGKGKALNIRIDELNLDKLSISFEQISHLEPGQIRKVGYKIFENRVEIRELTEKYGQQVLGFPFFPGLGLDCRSYALDVYFENAKNELYGVRIKVDRVNKSIFKCSRINLS